MLNRRSIYALNKKDKEAIVYLAADGTTIRLTREDFSLDAEFEKWKAWSDENFHEEELGDHVYYNHTLPFDERYCTDDLAESTERTLLSRFEQRARERFSTKLVIDTKARMTETQFRRMWLYHVVGLDEEEIAIAEHVTQQSVNESMFLARQKLDKILNNL